MAKIKSWKKMKTENYHIADYFNATDSHSLCIRKVGDGTTNVEVFNNKSGVDEVVRNFDSQKKAIAYAMNYMRSH